MTSPEPPPDPRPPAEANDPGGARRDGRSAAGPAERRQRLHHTLDPSPRLEGRRHLAGAGSGGLVMAAARASGRPVCGTSAVQQDPRRRVRVHRRAVLHGGTESRRQMAGKPRPAQVGCRLARATRRHHRVRAHRLVRCRSDHLACEHARRPADEGIRTDPGLARERPVPSPGGRPQQLHEQHHRHNQEQSRQVGVWCGFHRADGFRGAWRSGAVDLLDLLPVA